MQGQGQIFSPIDFQGRGGYEIRGEGQGKQKSSPTTHTTKTRLSLVNNL